MPSAPSRRPRLLSAAAAAVVVALALPASASAATTYTVSTTGDPGNATRCPATGAATCSLRAAVAQNEADGGGDTVDLPPGHYHLASRLIAHHALMVTGAGAAAETVVDADGGPGALGMNLDGQADRRVGLRHLTVTGSVGGSAIDIVFAALTLQDVDVRDNSNTNGVGLGGGLLLITHATANVVDSTFAGNSALAGGAIAMAQDSPDDHLAVEGSELTGNRAFGRTGGGAILAGFGDVGVHASRLDTNVALTGPALASYPDAELRPTIALRSSTFDANRALDVAGGVAALPAATPGTLIATSDTFTGNSAPAGAVFAGPHGAVLLHDSVVAATANGACGSTPSTVTSQGHNVVDDDSCELGGAGDRASLDPRLGPLDGGGRAAGFPPRADSPLLEVADGAGCGPGDQHGLLRPQGAGCDIGAVERAAGAPQLSTSASGAAGLSGTVDPGGLVTTVTVETGATTAYGSSATVSSAAGWLPVAVRAAVPAPGVTLHVRLVARNALGTAAGEDRVVSGPPAPPGIPGTPPPRGGTGTLDDRDALAIARYGAAEAWLRGRAGAAHGRELVFRATTGATARVLPLSVPAPNPGRRTPGLALGLDAHRQLMIVLEDAHGLASARVAGTRFERVPGTTSRDGAPSLFRGALAFTRSGTSVRLGALSGGRSRVLWRVAADVPEGVVQTAVGAGRAVAFVTVRDGAGDGIYRAMLARSGHAVKRLALLPLGDTHHGALTMAGVRTDGRRVTVTRRRDAAAATLTFALPGGAQIRGGARRAHATGHAVAAGVSHLARDPAAAPMVLALALPGDGDPVPVGALPGGLTVAHQLLLVATWPQTPAAALARSARLHPGDNCDFVNPYTLTVRPGPAAAPVGATWTGDAFFAHC